MNMKSLISNKTMNLILAIVLFIAGILFCVSPAIGEQWVSLVIGIGVLLVGAITAVTDFLQNRNLLSRAVIIGSILVAIGIYLMVERSIISKVIGVIPYILIVTGACVLADSFLLKFVRKENDDKKFAIQLSIGAVAIILGGLILGILAFRQMVAVVIGVALAGYSGYYLYNTFKKEKSEKKDGAKKEEKSGKTEKAEKAEKEPKKEKAEKEPKKEKNAKKSA